MKQGDQKKRKNIFLRKEEKIEYFFFDRDGGEFICGKNRLDISKKAAFLLRCMDGKTNYSGLRQKFKDKFGVELTGEDLKIFIQISKRYDLLAKRKNGCLVSKQSEVFQKNQLRIFKRIKIREPQFAGICYSSKPKELKKDLRNCFALVDNRRLGVLTNGVSCLKGIIVPHSNLDLSGPCAAWAYEAMAKLYLPDLLIILAPEHSASIGNPFSVLCKDFLTPLGLVKTCKDFIELLKKKCSFDILVNNLAHLKEHSIEIQLPFLQYIYRENLDRLKIVPILCAAKPRNPELKSVFDIQQKEFICTLKELITDTHKNVCLIATGDLMHSNNWNLTQQFHQKNKEMMSLLKQADAESFKLGLSSGGYKSCGKTSFYPFLKLLVSPKVRIMNYSWTSNSIFLQKNQSKIQYRNIVNIGYVSMIFY